MDQLSRKYKSPPKVRAISTAKHLDAKTANTCILAAHANYTSSPWTTFSTSLHASQCGVACLHLNPPGYLGATSIFRVPSAPSHAKPTELLFPPQLSTAHSCAFSLAKLQCSRLQRQFLINHGLLSEQVIKAASPGPPDAERIGHQVLIVRNTTSTRSSISSRLGQCSMILESARDSSICPSRFHLRSVRVKRI